MAGPFFNVIGGKYVDYAVSPRYVIVDIFAGTVSNASVGILAALRTGGALIPADLKRVGTEGGTRLRVWIKSSVEVHVSYKKVRGAVTDTYNPAGSSPITALAAYLFEVPITDLDESFDVFVDATGTVSLIIEEI
jgi:hypothetical protein